MKHSVLFSHADATDPFMIYEEMRQKAPVCYDDEQKLWGVYTYAGCHDVLQSSSAFIPTPEKTGDEEIDKVVNGLVRLANGEDHAVRRAVAGKVFSFWRYPDLKNIFIEGIRMNTSRMSFDWVSQVSSKIPMHVLLKGFNLDDKVVEDLTEAVPGLVRLMNPVKNGSDLAHIRASLQVVKENLMYLSAVFSAEDEVELELQFSNFIGLMIQTYDAGIGTFCNLMLQFIHSDTDHIRENINGFVRESFRLLPPFHNTRRIANEPLELGGYVIKAKEPIILFLAAANRDPEIFSRPSIFDIHRSNADQALTFGAGSHACIARQFSEQLGADLIRFLLSKKYRFRLINDTITFQPKANARLPQELMIKLV